MVLQKQNRHESKKLRDSARGQLCMVRIPGVCNFNTETTILAHLNGGGAGTKKSELFGAFCCSDCHDVLDGRVRIPPPYTTVHIKLMHYEGVERTQQIWLDDGLVKLA
jgi:hypothetical protein